MLQSVESLEFTSFLLVIKKKQSTLFNPYYSGDGAEKLGIMFSVPYKQWLVETNLFHSNWMGIGIFPKGDDITFDRMYNKDQDNFKRKEYKSSSEYFEYHNDRYTVVGIMTTGFQANVKVVITKFLAENYETSKRR